MATTIAVQVTGLDDVKRKLNALKIPKAEGHQVIAGVLKSGAKKRFVTQKAPDDTSWEPSKRALQEGGTTLRKKSHLMNSITARADATAAYVGTNIAYARIHQFGGVVVPKKGKALAIPMTREAEKNGKPSNFPRPLRLVWEKGMDHGWLVEDKAGKGKAGRGAKAIMQYLLVRKVTIPARPFLGVSKEDVETIRRQLLQLVERRLGTIASGTKHFK